MSDADYDECPVCGVPFNYFLSPRLCERCEAVIGCRKCTSREMHLCEECLKEDEENCE